MGFFNINIWGKWKIAAATWGVIDKKVSKKFCNIHREKPGLESLFNYIAGIGGLQGCKFIIKRLQHKFFPVNIIKLLRKLILINIRKRLLPERVFISLCFYLIVCFFWYTYLRTVFHWCSEKSNFKQKVSTTYNQEKIKRRSKKYATRTRLKFWPMKNIFRKL